MTETITESPTGERILALLKDADIKGVEEAWLTLPDAPPTEALFYEKVIKGLSRIHELEKGHDLFVVLLTALQEKSDWANIITISEVAAEEWPDSQELRKPASKALKGLYGSNPLFSTMISGCKGASLDVALARFHAYLQLCPGQVYQHVPLGEGVVQALDLPGNKVTIDFASEKGKVFTLSGVRQYLKYLPPDHILAIRTVAPEKLVALAEDSPVELVRLALHSYEGRIKQSDLKQILLGRVISESSWNSWWTKMRTELRMDPLIDLDAKGGARAEITLRTAPKTVEEEIEELFFGPETALADRVGALKLLVKSIKGSPTDAQKALLTRMRDTLQSEARHGKSATMVDQLQTVYLLEDVCQILGQDISKLSDVPKPAALLKDVEDYAVLAIIDDADYAARALHVLLARDGEGGFELAARVIAHAPIKLAQAIWKELDKEHHALIAVKGLQELFDRPLENPDTYFWAAKAIVDGGWEHLEEHIPLTSMVPDLFAAMDDWHTMIEKGRGNKETLATAKSLLGKVRALLQSKNFSPVFRCAEQMTIEQAREFQRMIQLHPAVNEAFRGGAERQFNLVRREGDTKAASAAPAQDFVFCTAKAREKSLRELEELNTVKIPFNAKEIEKARAEGDLKENAGYHAARERHVLLLQQANQLQLDLDKCRVISAAQVSTDSIAFGVKFVAQNLGTNEHETYTVLGQWESDPDHGIYSAKAPLLQQFLGAKVGAEVSVKRPDGTENRYKILSIENALKSGAWDLDKA
ncbi:MAG: GreA/GreB family elongation factor [Candidatus Sumerlaeaceae bacterium]|nr:GreA/GreB family elongation factor [Candidatus Sumerlaeaceae bacterium]